MPDENSDSKSREQEPDQKRPPGEFRLTPAGKKTARYEELPVSPPDKKIHPRRRMPPVPEKTDEQPEENDEDLPHPPE
jgi:hypothetical protein